MALNRIVVIGRLTSDPSCRTTQNGVAVTTFTIACDRDFKNSDGEKETDFIPVVTWRGLAENCEKYLAKGKMAAVEGRLQIRTYEANDGGKRTVAEIVADNVQFLTPKGEYSEPVFGEEMPAPEDIPFE